jgi:hypothetical protein
MRVDLNLAETGLVRLETVDQLHWSFMLRPDVAEWCADNLDHPVEVIITQEVYGLTMHTQIGARFQSETDAFHFKTRWWGT